MEIKNDVNFKKYLENKSNTIKSLKKEYPLCDVFISIDPDQYGNLHVSANYCPKKITLGDFGGWGSEGFHLRIRVNLIKEYKLFQKLRRKEKLISLNEQSR